MGIPALQLRNLGCTRGGRSLFGALSLDIPPGRLLRVNGANGTGKTSLLRMLCGLLLPSRGEVLWHGQPIADVRDDFHRQLVYLGHAAALKDDLSAEENLSAAAQLAGLAPSARDVQAALAAAGLHGLGPRLVRNLSQGQRRRVALARLMLDDTSQLWVLDEPFNALDATASAWLHDLVTRQVRRGAVVVLTSHDAALAWPHGLPQLEIAL